MGTQCQTRGTCMYSNMCSTLYSMYYRALSLSPVTVCHFQLCIVHMWMTLLYVVCSLAGSTESSSL